MLALGECTIERRPAGATGELAGGLKQREAAHHAAVDAVFFVVEQGPQKGRSVPEACVIRICSSVRS